MPVLAICGDPVRAPCLRAGLGQPGPGVELLEPARAWAAVDALASFDLVVLDLAGQHGRALELLRLLRMRHALLPVLVIAAGTCAQERVAALDAGADDCLPCDVSDAELAARVRVRLRRRLDGTARRLRFGPLGFDSHDRTAFLDEQPLRLSNRELSLFETLIRRPGSLVSSQTLLERLFERHETVTLNAVQVHVCRLRRKIDHGAVRIATVRGLGYCLELDRQAAA